MKKTALFLLTLLTLWSCGDEVEFNTPGFQANKNYNLWRATYYSASYAADGSLTIVAGNNHEEMRFVVHEISFDTIDLTTSSFAKAEFRDFNDMEYSTSNPPDPSVSLYPEIGKLIFLQSPSGTVSGEFRFIAFTDDGLNSVGFNEGYFSKIPISGGSTSGTVNCLNATAEAAEAQADFAEVTPEDPQYTELCSAYKQSLEQLITACGDPGGAFQSIINGLGDCN